MTLILPWNESLHQNRYGTKATGDEATRLFLARMIEHHNGAITMAKQELANGQNSEAKQLAQDIIDAQQAEIVTMNQLLDQL